MPVTCSNCRSPNYTNPLITNTSKSFKLREKINLRKKKMAAARILALFFCSILPLVSGKGTGRR